MDWDILYGFWPLALAIGWAIFACSFVVLDLAAARALRVVSVIAFVLAAVFAIPGIT